MKERRHARTTLEEQKEGQKEDSYEQKKVQSPREDEKEVHLHPVDVDAEGGGGMPRG